MADIKALEKRWEELASKPKTKEEIEETLLLAKQIAIERAKEHQVLTDELAGINIVTIWDLVNTKSQYPLLSLVFLFFNVMVKIKIIGCCASFATKHWL